MESNIIKLHGPVEIEMRVFVVNEETGKRGKISFTLAAFTYPTQKQIAERLKLLEDEQLAGEFEGYRLMTKSETMTLCEEQYEGVGINFTREDREIWDPLDEEG